MLSFTLFRVLVVTGVSRGMDWCELERAVLFSIFSDEDEEEADMEATTFKRLSVRSGVFSDEMMVMLDKGASSKKFAMF